MSTGPTPEQVAAQVAMIRRYRPEARVIGMHTPGAWLGEPVLKVNGETFHVTWCASALQIREVLVSLTAADPPLLVLTPLDDRQLGLDVVARLAGRQLYRIDRWQMVRDLFHARDIDPRLPSQEWLADTLLQHIPPGGYPPVASGLLDADTAWNHLDALLYEAQLAQRAIVITSDHGHVLETGTRRLARSAEERWRPYDDQLAAEEIVIAGSRVQDVTGAARIVALWSETVRYSQKKQGYHGGVTLQEVLIPLAVLVPQHRTIAGWEALPDRAPVWWSQSEISRAEAPILPVRSTRRTQQLAATQGTLFADLEGRDAEEPGVDWLDHLLHSPVFAVQRRMVGRRGPDDTLVRTFLTALEMHGGRLTRRLLIQALGEPEFRLQGILMGLQRLLNVDGYQVIAVDDISGTVTLNRQFLNEQFQ